jgi:GT2 family glycosyltransferase
MAAVLSVAIINFETPDLTANCVAAVHRNPPAEPYEVVVVDNGSRAETLSELRAVDGARLVETGVNGGFAAGVNRCVAESDPAADVIVVLNSDTEVEPGALDALGAAARRPGVGLSAPVILDRQGGVQRSGHRRFPTPASTWVAICTPLAFVLWALERHVRHPTALSVAEHEAGVEPAHVMGAVLAIRRQAWDAVGPFDEGYFLYFEETEWQERLQAAGWRVALVPTARVRHLHRGGDDSVGVPSLFYLDSARRYFTARGRGDGAVRAVLASSLLVSWLALAAYGPLTRFVPAHRSLVRGSRPLAWRGFVHAALGRRRPRPDGR